MAANHMWPKGQKKEEEEKKKMKFLQVESCVSRSLFGYVLCDDDEDAESEGKWR